MSNQKTIAVLFHETMPPKTFRDYRVYLCSEDWTEWGFDVRFVQGPNADVDADLLIPHIDLSVTPDEYLPLFDRPKMVMNRRVLDIRKSAFSRNLVSPDDDYDGPVIVKTDRNYGGLPERQTVRRLPPARRMPLVARRAARALRQVVRARSLSRLAYADALVPKDYPIYPSKDEVPSHVFANPDLIVEKFLPEFDGRYYYTRSYTFLGSGGITIRVKSECQVVKGSNAMDLEFVPVDESILAARHALGFEFGKFDYVMHDGQAVLIDVNRTPTYGRVISSEARRIINVTLAKGIVQWFPDLEL
jgi:hypothetical protein